MKEDKLVETNKEHITTARRIGRNFIWLTLTEAIGRGVIFITNMFLARALGVKGFGVFALAQTLTFYFWLAVDIGTTTYAIREISKDKSNAETLIGTLFSVRIVLGLLVVSAYSLVLVFVPMEHSSKLAFLGCGLYLVTHAIYTDWAFKGLERVSYLVAGTLVSSVLFLAGTVFLVKDGGDVPKASFLWSLSFLPGGILLFYFLQYRLGLKLRFNLNLKEWLWHIKGSIWFAIAHGLMIVYQNLPILLLGWTSGAYDVGLYAGAYRIVLTAYGASFLVFVASYPVLSDTYANRRHKFKKVFLWFAVALVGVGGGISLVSTSFAPQIIRLLLGDQYSQSVPIFRILVWLLPLFFLRDSVWAVLSIEKAFNEYNKITVAGILALAIGAVVAVEKYGIIGLSTVLVAVEMVCDAMFLVTLRKRLSEERR